jgi:hypothetical protein
MSPNGISHSGGDAHSLILWSDANFSGYTICFKGAGGTDLTSYCLAWYDGGCLYSWNDWAVVMLWEAHLDEFTKTLVNKMF